jgi:hypothetical protein
MPGGTQNPHAAGAMLDHRKDVDLGTIELVVGAGFRHPHAAASIAKTCTSTSII